MIISGIAHYESGARERSTRYRLMFFSIVVPCGECWHYSSSLKSARAACDAAMRKLKPGEWVTLTRRDALGRTTYLKHYEAPRLGRQLDIVA